MPPVGLRERLASGESVIVGEGYLFEFERRGYLQAGPFVPEVVTEHPELVRSLHEEFVHAGSDVVLAFTYYGHREKMRLIGKEDQLEALNVKALKIARQVADKTGTLMAGNISNTTVYERGNQTMIEQAEAMFKEQIEWAVQQGADFIVGETFSEYGEAKLALDSIKKYGNGLPAVVTLVPHAADVTPDGMSFGEACRKLEEGGADVVGLNCCRGPKSILPLIREIRQACKGPIAAVPVPYRTTLECPTMQSFKDQETGKQAFPDNLIAHLSSRSEIFNFGLACREIGVQYVGLCCGSSSGCLRSLAQSYGRIPPACKYAPDMSKHFIYGSDSSFKGYYQVELKSQMAK